MTFDIGDLVTLTCAFTVSGTATNPTAVTCKVKKPGVSATTYTYGTDSELTRPSTGNYELALSVDYDSTYVGEWYYQWRGTGTCQAVEEGMFIVRAPHV